MESVFSVDEISDPFSSWPSSPNPSLVVDSALPSAMNRSSSLWYFQKFLEINSEAPDALGSPNPSPDSPPGDLVGSNFATGATPPAAEVEIKRSGGASDAQPAAGDPEYVANLKKKLSMYCAVAISRNSSATPNDTTSVGDCSSPGPNASQLAVHETVKGGVSNGLAAPTVMQNLGIQGTPGASASSRELSDDDDLDGEAETMENIDNLDPSDIKRQRRMLSNRESARRSRRRKQDHLTELETQVGQLNVENSTLLKRLTGINQKYNTAAVDNRILKADVETLRAKVKMAEESVKRVTGVLPLYPTMSGMSPISLPFNGSPSDLTSDSPLPIQDDPNSFFNSQQAHDRCINTYIPEIASIAPVGNGNIASATKTARTAAMKPVAGPSVPWESHVWSPETSVNNKQK